MESKFPELKSFHINKCDISNWYFQFKKITIPTKIIPLPGNFVEYLLADSVLVAGLDLTSHGEYDVSSDDESTANNTEEEAEPPEFPELDSLVRKAIEELGGSVFPKLNWSAPKDATWIAFGNTLKCSSLADISLLLKSSDFILHDLKNAYQYCVDNIPSEPKLCLRRWIESLNPSHEFRCFIRNMQLIGISQRDVRNFYPNIATHLDKYRDAIISFYQENIRNQFELTDCNRIIYLDVMDIYINTQNSVRLLDFNPFSPTTDPLLFQWSEILESASDNCTFKCNLSEKEAQGTEPAYTFNRLPKEAFDFSHDGSSIADFAKRFNDELIASFKD